MNKFAIVLCASSIYRLMERMELNSMVVRMSGELSDRVLVQGLRTPRFKPLPLHPVVEVSYSLTFSSCH